MKFARLLIIAAIVALGLAPVRAAVNTSANKTIALGNGAVTQFAFSFIGVACQYLTVIYTDALGNQTTLTQGTGATQYQCALNSAVQGAIWGYGGTITYNPSSIPIANGTTLTIFRTLPLTQAITLQNQASVAVLGKGAETGLDTGVMQGQQISEAIGRAIQANIANTSPPLPLPPAAQLANLGLCADSTGNNIIGCMLPSSGVISSAMQPVVNAASLAVGRTAFGLGSMSQENINGGTCGGATIQDDGSAGGANGVGYARVVFGVVSDSTNQTAGCSFHMSQRIATGPITYALVRANTLFNGFGFTIYVASGQAVITPNASDNFSNVVSGGSVVVGAGSSCFVTTNAASSGLWELNCNNSPPSLTASVSSNALTISLAAASAINFRSPTIGNGSALWAIPAGNLSIVLPSGATLGTSNGVPFRVWIFLAYNSGTPILGVATCSSAAAIYACTAWETVAKSGTAITSGSTSIGTLYTASTVTNDAVRIIGYADYASGLSTAGTYASAPTTLQICLPPFTCKRPGDVLQSFYGAFASAGNNSTSTSFIASTATTNITLTSTPNVVRRFAAIGGNINSAGGFVSVKWYRANTSFACTNVVGVAQAVGTGGTTEGVATLLGLDGPATLTQQAYGICYASSSGGTTVNLSNVELLLEEVMGALEPANDNGNPQHLAA